MEAGEVARQLGALAALPENKDSIPTMHVLCIIHGKTLIHTNKVNLWLIFMGKEKKKDAGF